MTWIRWPLQNWKYIILCTCTRSPPAGASLNFYTAPRSDSAERTAMIFRLVKEKNSSSFLWGSLFVHRFGYCTGEDNTFIHVSQIGHRLPSLQRHAVLVVRLLSCVNMCEGDLIIRWQRACFFEDVKRKVVSGNIYSFNVFIFIINTWNTSEARPTEAQILS